MRILFINQFFWPDAAPTSQLLTDLTRALSTRGHEITVICGNSTYEPGDATEDTPPVTIHRVAGLPFSRGKLARPLSYLSFLLAALWTGFRIPAVDVVVTMTTPPMLFVVGAILQRFRGMHHFIWAMDLFPETFVDVGVFKAESRLMRVLRRIAEYVYWRADGVIAIGDCMRQRLRGRVQDHRLHVVENWADGRTIFPIGRRRDGPLLLVYSGNLGMSHEIETLLFAMESLNKDERFHFRFVGSGTRQAELQELCRQKKLQNVSFLPRCSRARLAESLSEADIGLVTQRLACHGSVVPSKVYGLMAAGKPILYIGPRGTTPFWIIERFQCGWHVECGDGAGLVKLLESGCGSRYLTAPVGARARAAFLAHYDMPQAVDRICSLLGGWKSEARARELISQSARASETAALDA